MKKTGKILIFAALIAAMAGLVWYAARFGASPEQKLNENTKGKKEGVTAPADPVQTASTLAESAEAAWKSGSAAAICLDDRAAKVPAGVSVQGSTVTISAGGIYSLNGRLTEGQLFVECSDNVTLILDDAEITNSSDAAIKIKKSAHTLIYLPEGSESVLTCGTEQAIGAAEDEDVSESGDAADAEGAAVYSKDDLSLAGSGRLSVAGYINNAVATTDHLVILGGEIEIKAVNNGLKGKDSVTILDGKIDITSGNDGIKSNNDEDEEWGNIAIYDGEIRIVSYGDGMQAEKALNVEGGVIDITAGDVSLIGSGNTAGDVMFGGFGGGFDMSGGFHGRFGETEGDMQMPEGMPELPGGTDGMTPPAMPEYMMYQGDTNAGAFGGRGGKPDRGNGQMPEGGTWTRPDGQMPEGGTWTRPDGQTPEGGAWTRPDGRMPEGGTWTRPDGQTPEGGTWTRPDGRMPEGGAWTRPDGRMPGTEGTDPSMNGKGFGGQQVNTSSDTSTKGLKSGSSLNINGGTITVRSQDDCVHSNGDLVIAGGILELSTADDALHADNELTIIDGAITVVQSYEGIEGYVIRIKGGTIDVTSSDDGINAGGNAYYTSEGTEAGAKKLPTLQIEGGTIYVNAAGDGLDSNGDLIVDGGTIIVDGPSNSGNGALDSGTESGGKLVVNGGTVLAIGASGMAESFKNESKQCSFIYNYAATMQAGTAISITDEDGNVLFSHTCAKSFNSVVFSSPELKIGESITLTVGDTSEVVEIADIVNGNAGGDGMSGGFGGRTRR